MEWSDQPSQQNRTCRDIDAVMWLKLWLTLGWLIRPFTLISKLNYQVYIDLHCHLSGRKSCVSVIQKCCVEFACFPSMFVWVLPQSKHMNLGKRWTDDWIVVRAELLTMRPGYTLLSTHRQLGQVPRTTLLGNKVADYGWIDRWREDGRVCPDLIVKENLFEYWKSPGMWTFSLLYNAYHGKKKIW